MTYRDRQRLADIQAAIDAIRSHLQRGDLSDGLVFDAVRIRLLEIGEAVKALPAELLDTQPGIPWRQITRMRDHLAHRYFDTAHAILQATVDEDLPELERAIRALAKILPDEDQPDEDTTSEGAPGEEPPSEEPPARPPSEAVIVRGTCFCRWSASGTSVFLPPARDAQTGSLRLVQVAAYASPGLRAAMSTVSISWGSRLRQGEAGPGRAGRAALSISDLHRLGRRDRSTLISFAKFEVLFNRQQPGSWAPGGSQSGSQRAQPSGDVRRRPATITPGERHIGRRRATSGDWVELIWEQEAAGSNPAIPTIFRICCPLVGAILVASYCRPMSAGVAQRRRTLAPTCPPDRPTTLSVEPEFD